MSGVLLKSCTVQLGPTFFGQNYFECKKYNTVSTRFLFIHNTFAQRFLVPIVHSQNTTYSLKAAIVQGTLVMKKNHLTSTY